MKKVSAVKSLVLFGSVYAAMLGIILVAAGNPGVFTF